MDRALLRHEIRLRAARGESVEVVARELSVPRSTAYRWVADPDAGARVPLAPCWICETSSVPPDKAVSYTYLLGQYLGDGHLVTSSRVPVLRVYTCTDYPDLVAEVERSIATVRERPAGRVRFARTKRMITVQSYWMHWPCVFPQHGPGRKHLRPIVLAPWQQEIVDAHPWPLIRGLIHSDGCRAINRVVVRGKAYSYPRYLFANESTDILSIMGDALDRVGAEWRYNRPNSISIARRASVALLDVHVGRKT